MDLRYQLNVQDIPVHQDNIDVYFFEQKFQKFCSENEKISFLKKIKYLD